MIKRLYEKSKIPVITLSIIILGILLIMFIIKPSVIGYATYQKAKSSNYTVEDYGKSIQELKLKLLISDTNLSSCNAFNNELLTELEKYSDKFSECKSELSALEINFNVSNNKYEEIIKNLENGLNEKNKELEELKDQRDEELAKLKDEKEAEINDLKLEYEVFVQNTANNICCKAKVDNPDIKYYKVENNKIVCLEEGTLSISC